MDRKAVAKSVLSSAARFRILNEGNKSTWNHNEEHMQCVCVSGLIGIRSSSLDVN